MTVGAHSAHRSRFPRRRHTLRALQRAMILTEMDALRFQAEWAVFAARVADQRYDGTRAAEYRHMAEECARGAKELFARAEKCRPLRERAWLALVKWSRALRRSLGVGAES